MVYVEEQIETKAAPKKIWQAWNEAYRKGGPEKKKQGFKEGAKGKIASKGKSVPFKIIDVKKNETFTTLWKSFLVKFYFIYRVKQLPKGSLIMCRVKVGGALGFLVAPFLKKKIKKNVKTFLHDFVYQVEQKPVFKFR